MSVEPLPKLEIADIDLHGRFYTSESPVQAWGTVAGHRFYFRARHEHWSFSVSNSDAVDPIDIQYPSQGFYREAQYGSSKFAASYMPLETAAQIIESCARDYVQSKNC